MSKEEIQRCPHCGYNLNPDERITYKFSSWTTTFMVFIISLMLFAFDWVGNYNTENLFEWSHYAIIGLWILFISVQLLRYQPNYTWLMVPISGIMFSVFLVGIDIGTGGKEGYAGLYWSWYAIIPILTFVVVLPIVARIFRQEPSHYDRLEYLVEYLADDKK